MLVTVQNSAMVVGTGVESRRLLVPTYSHLGLPGTFAITFTFSVAEYADMVYFYGFCAGNAVHAVPEYERHFPNRGILVRRVFPGVYQTLRDTDTLPSVHIVTEREVNQGVDEEESIVRMAECSPHASTRRIARRLHVPQTKIWRILHAEGVYPYHVQRMQHLGPGDLAQRLEFCIWFSGHRRFHRCILFTDKAQFTRDGISNTHKSPVWSDENLHATVEGNFQLSCSANVCCAVWDDQLTGPFIFEGRRTGEAYVRLL
jgi:hypothetical protein